MPNALLIFVREVRDQLRDKRTLFMLIVLPLLLYPTLGIGMFYATLMFNEAPRNVVVLGADELPSTSLLATTDDGRYQIDPKYFGNPADAEKLRVATDAEFDRPPVEVIADPATDPFARERALRVEAATAVADQVGQLEQLRAEIGPLLGQDERSQTDLATESLTADQRQRLADLELAADALTQQISQRLAAADIQILMLVPDGFRQELEEFNQQIGNRDPNADPDELTARPRPQIVQNTADEKSAAAVRRVNAAVRAWERTLLSERLKEANLPSELAQPVNATPLDVARSEERAANVWSRLFPFLLILMSVTGAFYPAIDLGAGEKERGTMETLLICPATRGEIVTGKFFTVFAFSLITTVLNILSMGATGGFLIDVASVGPSSGFELPPPSALAWVVLFALPMAAMFSALSLALAMFARSSKEGQYYLTPLVTVTIGLALFASAPQIGISPFYSIMPVVGPALLLKGFLSPGTTENLLWYLPPVLISSVGYSVLALWWARDQFDREEILFREADRFDLASWLRQLITEKAETPTFAEGLVCLFILMLLQLVALKVFRPLMLEGSAQAIMTSVVMQQTLMLLLPAVLLGFALTANIRKTFLLYLPSPRLLAAGFALPLLLHPLTLELSAFLDQHFFEPLPESFAKALEPLSDSAVPWWIAVAVFALTPAICEEVVFRGFLLTGFSTGRRWTLGIICSSLAFGLIHVVPQQVFNAALLGLVLGVLATRSGSLLPGIAFHVIYNGLQVARTRAVESAIDFAAWPDAIVTAEETGLRYGWGLLVVCGVIAAGVLIWLVRQPISRRFEKSSEVRQAPLATAA